MTWRPSARIVRPGCYASAYSRGAALQPALSWPDTNIGAGADYSVDFAHILGPGETIKSFSFDAGASADRAWLSAFGTVVSAFMTWKVAGETSVEVCVLSDVGNSYQISISIFVDATPALIAAVPPPSPGDEIPQVNDATMSAWLNSLPTSPPASGGYWNNAGIATYQEPSL